MKTVYILLGFSLCLGLTPIWAQKNKNQPHNEEEKQAPATKTSVIRSAKDLLADAELHFNRQQYQRAKEDLLAALSKKDNFPVAQRLLAITYLKLGEYENALATYQKLFQLQADLSKGAYYEAGQAAMHLYQYDKALEYLLLYKNAQSRDYKSAEETAELNYKRYLDMDIRHCKYAKDAMIQEQDLKEAQNLGSNINSAADEYMPTLSIDGRLLIFTTNQEGNENVQVSRLKKDSSSWSKSQSIGRAINTELNEGQAFLASCGRTLYFAACAWDNVQGGCDIYQAEYSPSNDVFGKVLPAKGGSNSEGWDSQPAISCDGKTMYFASTRKGGQGGTDIWMSKLQADGVWGEPQNLGSSINTPFDEEAPYIAPDGTTLYFSSDGHPGFGEADLFRTELQADGKWTKPQNLGPVFNTPFREAGFSLSPAGDQAFFGSARRGGKGGLDIYQAYLPKPFAPKPNVMLDGYVYDELSKKPIEGAKVQVGKTGQPKLQLTTDVDGRFFICLPDAAAYSYIVDKETYNTYIGADFFQRQEGEPARKVKVYMSNHPSAKLPTAPPPAEPSKRLRKNLAVYFETGKFDLLDIQKEQIAELINQFEDKKNMKIRVTGFADDVGDREFNLNLSEKRANFVAEYIQGLGVPKEQITYDGKGVAEGNLAKHQKRKVEIIILN